jgi:hypothetical protein
MRSSKVCCAAIGLLLVAAQTARAQGVAESFQELRLLTRAGETVSVVGVDGRQTTGEILDLTAARLLLRVSGQPRDLSEMDVQTIWQRRADPLGNGATWGLAVGAGFGLVVGLAATYYSEGYEVGWALLAAGVYGGLGAGIGVGVDALIQTRQVIYATPGASRVTMAVSPVLTPSRTGAVVSFRF